LTAIADKVLSTEGMCRYAAASSKTEFIIATELGILHRMAKDNPGKKFTPLQNGHMSQHETDDSGKSAVVVAGFKTRG